MSLAFLNPLLWLGALAIAAPLWLHLRRKEPTNLHKFSALQFLDDLPRPRQSPLRLRELILLTLRMLALLLLVTAFAWPYRRSADGTGVQESRVYILDNSLSHQANSGSTRDRDRVLTELSNAGKETQIAVIELTANPRVIASFGEEREAAKQKVQALQPSFQRGSYLAAFRQANTLLGNSLGERKRIILLGDNQENQWTENLSTPPFLQDVELELPKGGGAALPNLALAEPRAQRVFLGDKSLVNFTVQLSHSGAAKTANILLQVNGQVIFSRRVDFQKETNTLTLQAQWETTPALALRGEVAVEGEPDVLPGDNRSFFALPPVQEGKVALLAQSPYLRLALSPEVMRGQWATRLLEPAQLAAELAANNDADVLCIESNYLQSGDARKLLGRYLANGRGVFLVVNRVTLLTAGYLRELGFEALPPAAGPLTPAKFQYVLGNHPVMHPFTSPEFGNLLDVQVTQPTRLRAPQALPLIFSETGEPLFFQSSQQPGKLFVSAFGFERDQTTWPLQPSFIPFLDLCLQHARAEDPTATTFEPGDVYVQTFPTNAQPREVVLRKEGQEILRAPVGQGKVQVRLPDQPGLYGLTYEAGTPVEKVLAVNPSPKESQLNYRAGIDLVKAWQRSASSAAPRPAATRAGAELTLAGIWQQRIWWWLLVVGLLALLMESVWLAWRKEAL
jgi:hypothetical protein